MEEVEGQCSNDVEKLLLMNLNPNFTAFKLDFVGTLRMIKNYLKSLTVHAQEIHPVILSDEAISIVYKAATISPSLS